MLTRRGFCALLSGAAFSFSSEVFANAHYRPDAMPSAALEELFQSPPPRTRPYVLWMWMGSNISKTGITRDLEQMEAAGIGGATIYTLADTLTPWACTILKSPTPNIVAFTEPWWALIHHAAAEADRLGLELILHNCAGYESSGGTWITPELSMQELVWSEQNVKGASRFKGILKRPTVDPHPGNPFPEVYIPSLGRVDVPVVEAKKTYFRDVAVLAVPAQGHVGLQEVLNISDRMKEDGEIDWQAPEGEWTVFRFGHTTTGAMIQPAQWDAMGLECDKMSVEAVTFHVQHVLSEMKKHLGDLMGRSVTTLYFDSYEAGTPTWTPKMPEEFRARRGYDPLPWLAVMAGRSLEDQAKTDRFKQDLERTIHDLYRDCYWATIGPLAHEAGLKFAAEPYEGPWEIAEVVKYLDLPTVEFWTTNNRYSPSNLDPVVKAAHAETAAVISAESFTSLPEYSQWRAHPAWLKPIGDAAFCAGVNRINVHNFVQQPWDDRYQPGNAMGQWGIHLGRHQTWWKPGMAWIKYLWRCQTLLQSGQYIAASSQTSLRVEATTGSLQLSSIHRRDEGSEIYFVANTAWDGGKASCSFPVAGKQPELWDPVSGMLRDLRDFEQADGWTTLPIDFAPSQSYFVVFRRPISSNREPGANFPVWETLAEIEGGWTVEFDPAWGGPALADFDRLQDWTTHQQNGIKYYSGTAIYKKIVTIPPTGARPLFLDLGTVRHLAEVTVNGINLGVVWTAPWRIDITKAVRRGGNQLEIAVTNGWTNRLIGDEQEPPDVTWETGDPKLRGGCFLKEFPEWFLKNESRPSSQRYTFTTWNYFTKDSLLEPSGLIGPVRLLTEA